MTTKNIEDFIGMESNQLDSRTYQINSRPVYVSPPICWSTHLGALENFNYSNTIIPQIITKMQRVLFECTEA